MEYIISGEKNVLDNVIREQRIRIARGQVKVSPASDDCNEQKCELESVVKERDELKAELESVMKERDELKTELEKVMSDTDNKELHVEDTKDVQAEDTKEIKADEKSVEVNDVKKPRKTKE